MITTKVQQSTTKSNSFNGKDFLTASKLANELKFQDFEVSEDTRTGNNWFGLFMAENNAYWSIARTENGKYNLECDDTKVCVIDEYLEKKLDDLRIYLLDEPTRKMQDQIEFNAFQNELWRNYGPGRV